LKDNGDLITQYNSEDDKKVLCLMIDEKLVIGIKKFIRTLFKTGRHYEFQLVKRDEFCYN
jgi:hypothetical protein